MASITEQAVLKLGNSHQKCDVEVETPYELAYVVDPYMGLSQCLISTLQRVSLLLELKVDDEDQYELLKAEIHSMYANEMSGIFT